MSQKTAKRIYTCSDGVLKQKGDSLILAMKRDATDFSKRNISSTDVSSLDTGLGAFADMPGDEESLGAQGVATLKKDKRAGEIRVALRPIRNMAEQAYGHVGNYKRFDFKDMDGMDDANLLRLACRTVRVGTTLMTDLSAKGLDTAQLTAITTLAGSFDKEIDDAHDEEVQRHIDAEARINAGNALWKTMSDYASVGKSIYADTDEAKYAQYVLTDGDGGGAPAAGGSGQG